MFNYFKVIMLTLMLISFSLLSVANSLSPEQVVKAHNQVRHNVNNGVYSNQPIANPPLLDLVWDQNLADSAQLYANQCTWQHSSNRINTGENLYVSLSSQAGQVSTIEQAVYSWAEGEYLDYNFSSSTCNAGKMCGHYTQVVWQNTLQVGCAVAACNPLNSSDGGLLTTSSTPYSSFIVCQYGPGGNINSAQPYETSGSDTRFLSNLDLATQILQVPYFLLHQADSNFVTAHQADFRLYSINPLYFQITGIGGANYQDFAHSDGFDLNTLQLFLTNLQLYNQGTLLSSHAVVLKYVFGTADLFELKSIK